MTDKRRAEEVVVETVSDSAGVTGQTLFSAGGLAGS
jgi:hypothetical protein